MWTTTIALEPTTGSTLGSLFVWGPSLGKEPHKNKPQRNTQRQRRQRCRCLSLVLSLPIVDLVCSQRTHEALHERPHYLFAAASHSAATTLHSRVTTQHTAIVMLTYADLHDEPAPVFVGRSKEEAQRVPRKLET